MFAQGIPPPFTLTTSIPRMCLSLCNVGNDTISSMDLENSLIMIEEGDEEELDHFLDFLQLSQEVCCSLSVRCSDVSIYPMIIGAM